MISLSLGNFAYVYASGLAALLLVWWLIREIFRARGERRRKRRAIHCAICGSLYENTSSDPLPACPQCGQRNERFSLPTV